MICRLRTEAFKARDMADAEAARRDNCTSMGAIMLITGKTKVRQYSGRKRSWCCRSRMEAFKALNEAGAEAEAAARRRSELRERAEQAGEEITQLSVQLEAAAAKKAHLQCALGSRATVPPSLTLGAWWRPPHRKHSGCLQAGRASCGMIPPCQEAHLQCALDPRTTALLSLTLNLSAWWRPTHRKQAG